MAYATLLASSNYRGAKTLVANFFGQAGKSITFHAKGYNGGTDPKWQVTLGGTTIWDSGTISGGKVGLWSLDLDVVCITTGASGSIRAIGRFLYQDNTNDDVLWVHGSALHESSITIDTTAALAFDFQADNTANSGYVNCVSAWIEEHD